jgi:protoporphyrinogen oxidase
MSAEVLVVGAGPAGLTTALALARRGVAVTVVERSDRVGGMAASIDVAGQRVDLGSHRLHPSAAPAVRQLLDELLGDDLQVRERNGRLRLGGRWVRFPFRPFDLARSVPPPLAVSLAAGVLRGGAPDGATEGATYADFVTTGLGRAALDHFHGPMAEKLWGAPAGQLSATLASRRISVRDRRSLTRRLARTARANGRTFLYPRRGYGQIVERLAAAAIDAGATIRTGARVDTVVASERDVGVCVDGEPAHVRRVVWTAPVEALAAAAGGAAPSVPHRALALVYLAIARPRWTPFDAHYVPDRDVAFARLSEPRNYRDGPDPDGLTVLCAELPCDVGDTTWSATDDDLAALVRDGVDRCGLPVPSELVTVHVERLPCVYPVRLAGEEHRRTELVEWADALPGTTVLGRQGLAVADNLHHVLDMGLAAAACHRADGTWDAARWAEHRRRFDGFVVDD